MEVGDEEDAERPRGVEEQEVARRQVQDQASAVHHQQTDMIHGEDHPEQEGHHTADETRGASWERETSSV